MMSDAEFLDEARLRAMTVVAERDPLICESTIAHTAEEIAQALLSVRTASATTARRPVGAGRGCRGEANRHRDHKQGG